MKGQWLYQFCFHHILVKRCQVSTERLNTIGFVFTHKYLLSHQTNCLTIALKINFYIIQDQCTFRRKTFTTKHSRCQLETLYHPLAGVHTHRSKVIQNDSASKCILLTPNMLASVIYYCMCLKKNLINHQ